MNYLDAALAFAILMSIFAGAVTTLMQGIWRILRVRQGNVIRVLKQIDSEVLQSSDLELTPDQRWDTIVKIIGNPTQTGGKALPSAAEIKAKANLPGRVGMLGAPQPTAAGPEDALKVLGRPHALASQYEWVSAEHVARRLMEVVKKDGQEIDHERASGELNRVIAKFEEYTAAMSAEFKRRSHWWTIAMGIGIAFVFNVNALLIFDNFLEDPNLAEHVIITGEQLKTASVTDAETTTDLLQQMDDSLRKISGKGIPIGPSQWPYAADAEPFRGFPVPIAYLVWALTSILTGVLMGLGAPFWFDVAKRVSGVRTVLGGLASTSERMSGAEANGDPDKRREIVANVLNDELGRQPMLKRKTFRNVQDGAVLKVQLVSDKVNSHLTIIGGDGSEHQWDSQELAAGVQFTLESSAGFYRSDLDIIFVGDDTSSVKIEITGNDDWTFSLQGKSGQVGRIVAPIIMA